MHLFEENESVIVTTNGTMVGEPLHLIVGDMTIDTCWLFTDVTPPDDWTGWKYKFDGSEWSENPDYAPFVAAGDMPTELD